MTAKLTDREAYAAMYSFLKKYCALTRSEDIGILLGSMSTLEDNGAADPAIQLDWNEAVHETLANVVRTRTDLRRIE